MVGARVHDRIGKKDYSVYARQVRIFLPMYGSHALGSIAWPASLALQVVDAFRPQPLCAIPSKHPASPE